MSTLPSHISLKQPFGVAKLSVLEQYMNQFARYFEVRLTEYGILWVDDPVFDLSFTVHELAMFVYDEPITPNSDFLCYKILPIGKSN